MDCLAVDLLDRTLNNLTIFTSELYSLTYDKVISSLFLSRLVLISNACYFKGCPAESNSNIYIYNKKYGFLQ